MLRSPDSVRARFPKFLNRNPALLPRGATVLIAFSGGPDSTVLLHLLREEAEARELSLFAAHYDHGLRPSSAREADLVVDRARAWGVPCAVGRADVGLEPRQAVLREARYAFLRKEALRVGANRVATGHQADDQAETVLFRLLRGTGLRGLRGIPLQRGCIVRPLLPFWRDEVLAYQKAYGLPCLDDPSNRDRRWWRARLRYDVLPALERVTGRDVRACLVALAATARRADRTLDGAAREALGEATREGRRIRVARHVLAAYDPELQARAIRILARQLGARLRRGGTRTAVEFIKLGRSGTAVDLGEGLQFWREFEDLWLGLPPATVPDEVLEIDTPAGGCARVTIGGHSYRVVWRTESTRAVRQASKSFDEEWSAVIALSWVASPVRVRGPRPGDRMRLRRGNRKLKQLFNELRIPVTDRRRRPVLEAAGQVVWIAGIGQAAGLTESSPDGESFFIGISDD